jgi:hypothetical protein
MPADTVHLVSSEGESFDVTSSAASMSQLVRNLIDESGDDDEAQEIPLPNVKSTILALVIEFMNHYESEKMTEIEKVNQAPQNGSQTRNLLETTLTFDFFAFPHRRANYFSCSP